MPNQDLAPRRERIQNIIKELPSVVDPTKEQERLFPWGAVGDYMWDTKSLELVQVLDCMPMDASQKDEHHPAHHEDHETADAHDHLYRPVKVRCVRVSNHGGYVTIQATDRGVCHIKLIKPNAMFVDVINFAALLKQIEKGEVIATK